MYLIFVRCLKKKNAKDSNNKLDLFRNMSTLKMEDSTYLPICLREMPSMLSPMVVSFVPDARPAQWWTLKCLYGLSQGLVWNFQASLYFFSCVHSPSSHKESEEAMRMFSMKQETIKCKISRKLQPKITSRHNMVGGLRYLKTVS